MSVPDNDSLSFIVYRIRSGDVAAFEQLFDKLFEPLLRKATYYLRDEDAAKDVVQEIFLNLWKNRLTLTTTVPLRNYMERACINRSLNHLRNQGKFYRVTEDLPDQVCEESFRYTPHSILSFEELQSNIELCIEGLPEKIRVPFLLSRFENLTYKEISERTGLSEVVVEKSIMRALRRLRSLVFKQT
jgi:RNA polymerase sigma-70 factor (family 1)